MVVLLQPGVTMCVCLGGWVGRGEAGGGYRTRETGSRDLTEVQLCPADRDDPLRASRGASVAGLGVVSLHSFVCSAPPQ